MADKLSKPLVLAAQGQKSDRYPVWFMRQAGRYLPEYQEIRKKMEFLTLCQNPKMAAEVTLQPLRRYDLDAAIIFSDILIPPVAMGQSLTFDKGHGPVLQKPIRSMADVKALKSTNIKNETSYVGEAIELTKKQLNPQQTMIGFAGAPFTVASYMIEGGSSKNFLETKKFLLLQTAAYEELLNKLSSVTVEYLSMQIDAGAEVLMLFDSWANQLTPADYKEFALPWVNDIIKQLKPRKIPIIYYPGQDYSRLWELQSCQADIVSVDWRCRLDVAIDILKQVGCDAGVQGNLDPLRLLGTEESLRSSVRDIIRLAKNAKSHIFNVGHGVTPQTPLESLAWVIDEVRKSRR